MVGLDGVRGRRYGVRMAMLHKTQKIEVYWVAHGWDWNVGVEGAAGAVGRGVVVAVLQKSPCGQAPLQIGILPDFEHVHWMCTHCPWDRTQSAHAPLLQAFDGINRRHGGFLCRQFVGGFSFVVD